MYQANRRGARFLVLVIAMLSTFVAKPAFAHPDPSDCDGTGVSLTLRTFRANGTTPILGSQGVEDGETIIYRTSISKPSDACAFEGGSLTIDPAGPLGPQDVTPAGGIPCVGGSDPGCAASVVSEPLSYVVEHADEANLPPRSVVAIARYGDGVVHDRDGDGPGPSATTTKANTVLHPDLAIVKTPNDLTINSGDVASFNLTVTNVGPATAKDVTISDSLPNTGGLVWAEDPDLAECSLSGDDLSCDVGDLAPGGTFTVTVSATAPADEAGTLDNRACTATTTPELIGNTPVLDNNCDEGSITIDAPLLGVTKVADDAVVSTTENIGFTINVNNLGLGTATSATLSDPLPGGDGIDWSIDPAYAGPGSCAITGAAPTQELACSFGDLATAASTSVHISSATTPDSAGTYDNTATADATNTAAAIAADTVLVNAPTLTIVKIEDATPVSTTEDIGYTITVGNAGPGTAFGASLNDPLPGGAGIDWSIDPAYAGLGSCSITGAAPSQTLACSFGDMTPGATSTLHISSATGIDSNGTYNNTASIGALNHDDVEASASIIVRPAPLSIVKTADATPVSVGDDIGYSIDVTNLGPGTAFGVNLSDPLPGGPGIDWSIDPAYAGPGSCSITGAAPSQTLTCSLGSLAADAGASVHVASETTEESDGTYANIASALGTNTLQVLDAADIVVLPAPLTISKVADTNPVSTTDEIGFTIAVSNDGPGTARAATLVDPLPTGPGLDWSIDPAYAGPGTCEITANVLACSFGDMLSSASASVHVTSDTTPDSAGTYDNTAVADALFSAPVTASASTIVNRPVLEITKVADDNDVSSTENIGFTVTVTNNGLGNAYLATLSDPLPGGAGIDWSIGSYAGPGTCAITGAAPSETLTCAFGTLAPAGTATIYLVSGTTPESEGTFLNVASAEAANNGAVTARDTVRIATPDIGIVKVADNATIYSGDEMGFSITVVNTGGGTAFGATLNDPLPGHESFDWTVASASAGVTCTMLGTSPVQDLACDLGDLAAGASVTVHVVTATAAPCHGLYENTAYADALNDDEVNASASVDILECCLIITATPDAPEVLEGNNIGFTFTLGNNGPSDALAATLSATLPSAGSLSWSISPLAAGCSITGAPQKLSCAYGTVPVGTVHTVHVVSPTSTPAIGSHAVTVAGRGRNVATVFASASTKVLGAAVPFLDDAECTPTVAPGGVLDYTVTGGNSGAAPATSATLTATLPAGASFVSGSPGATVAGDEVSWSLGTIVPGGSLSREFRVSIDAPHGSSVSTTVTLTTAERAPVTEIITALVSSADAATAGNANSVRVTALNGTPVNNVAEARSSVQGPAGQDDDQQKVARLWGDLAGPVTVPVGMNDSSSTISDGVATTTSSSELTSVTALGGIIRAETIRTVATATATAGGLTTSSAGSVIEGLTINGRRVKVDEPTTIDVKYPFVDYRTIARVDILPSTRTADGISVTGLRITLIEPFMGTPAGTVINISSSNATATFPGGASCIA